MTSTPCGCNLTMCLCVEQVKEKFKYLSGEAMKTQLNTTGMNVCRG